MAEKISSAQLTRLQTLWNQYAGHEMVANTRAARLSWATENCKRPITSFSDLTASESSGLINLLQDSLGIQESRPAKRQRQRLDRDAAHAAGTEGRRRSSKTVTLATAEDLQLLDDQLTAMGWSRVRLDAFLASPSSPSKGRGRSQLRTVGDVNRVLWALKNIQRRQSKQEASA